MTGIRFARPALLAPVLLASAIASGLIAPSVATAKAGVVRYASPSGSESAKCLKSAPCDIVTAINNAPSGAEVIVESGKYPPITQHLGGGNLDIHGVAGHSLPVITTSAQVAISLNAGSLSRLAFHSSGAEAVQSNAPVDHVVAIDTRSQGTACAVTVSLRDSLCLASGAGGLAVNVFIPTPASGVGHLHPILFNVTAEAPAANGTGVALIADAKNIVTLRVSNSILHGGKVDAVAETNDVTAAATILLKHSDYKTSAHKGSNGAPAVDGDSTDIHKAPRFVDAGHGNYAEKASSPTINLGISTPSGDTDIAGHPRWLGKAPDLGAYEFRQPPEVANLMPTHTTAHKATLEVQVNPEGLATKVHVVATLGKKTITTKAVSAGHGRAVTEVHLHIKGLKAESVYTMRAIATNTGGNDHTQKKSLRTGA